MSKSKLESEIRKSYNSVALLSYEEGEYHLRIGSDENIAENFVKLLARKMVADYSDNPLVLFSYPSGFMEGIISVDTPDLETLFASHSYQMTASFKTNKIK